MSYLAQTALLHRDLSVEKVDVIPILCGVQEMRFYGTERGGKFSLFLYRHHPHRRRRRARWIFQGFAQGCVQLG